MLYICSIGLSIGYSLTHMQTQNYWDMINKNYIVNRSKLIGFQKHKIFLFISNVYKLMLLEVDS